MTTQEFKRKLTTIFSADVAGYSRLMGEDEAATVKTLEHYKAIMSDLIRQHRGRVVDSPGDNLLAEFTSVVDAVQCAVATQKEFQAQNAELSENRRMRFRIGVNLGDVIEEDGRIYGDGVNIAARLESLADPGGVCISKAAFDQIESKLPLGYESIGEQSVKNIVKPVGAYRIVLDSRVTEKKAAEVPLQRARQKPLIVYGLAALIFLLLSGAVVWQFMLRPGAAPVEKAAPQQMTSPSTDKLSIAVLPFTNMSDDPKQEYFSDGISEDIITDLSKISGLVVIARNSSFAYKGKPVNVQQMGQELGVRYLLEGSIRKAGDQMRINAQLIDASNGRHLWAERYDGNIDDVFAMQDKVTGKIISALALKLTASEQNAVADKGTDNLQAYDEFLKGWQYYRVLTNEGFAEAKVHLEKAVELDPEFARAYALLATMYWKALNTGGFDKALGITTKEEWRSGYVKMLFLLQKAMKKPTQLAYALMARMYLFRYLHDEALTIIQKAVAMNPNDPEVFVPMSLIYRWMGKNREAIEAAKIAQRLDPNNPALYLMMIGVAGFPDGNLQESLLLLERTKNLNPQLTATIAGPQVLLYGLLGRNEEARTAFDVYKKYRFAGKFTVKRILLNWPYADPKTMDLCAELLIKAGAEGSATDYFRISRENLITGQKVKSLLYAHKISGTSYATGEQFSFEWAKNGDFKFIMGTVQDNGKSWVEGDVLFIQFEKRYGGLPYGNTIFINPRGSKESMNEYYMVNDLASIDSFALTD